MAKNLDIGKQLYEWIAEFGEGGGIDLPDCAVGAMCAQMDVEAANFLDNVEKQYPEELRAVGAKILVVENNGTYTYGYKIGVDADGDVHYYKGVPIQKILNIWDYGTADGKIPRTRLWQNAVSKLKYKYERATDRFYDILDKRYSGFVSRAKNTGGTIAAKMAHYKKNQTDYMSPDEYSRISKLPNGKILN